MAGPNSFFHHRTPSSLSIAQIQFERSPRFHYVSKALRVPGNFHNLIQPTLPEHRPIPMEPLDWEFGVRCNRPFEGIRRTGHRPKPPPRPRNFIQANRFQLGDIPAKKVVEETPTWMLPPPIFDPYNHQTLNEGSVDGPLKVWVYDFIAFLRTLVEIVLLLLVISWNIVTFFTVPFARFARSAWKAVRERMSWQTVICLFIAWLSTKFLPGFEGKVVEKAMDGGPALWRGSPPPLYVIRIPISALAGSK